MLNRIVNAILFILLLFINFRLSAEVQNLEWSPSKAAKSYKVEIREFDSKKIKVDTKVKQTTYNIKKLSPGIYEYRIGIINEFGKILVYSDWVTASVIQSLEPEGSVNELYYGGVNDKFQEIFISGEHFYEDTEVEVYSDNGSIPVKNLVRISGTELKFILDLKNAKPGTYDLKLTNPLNKYFIKKGFYILGKTRVEAEKKIVEASRASEGMKTNIDRKYFFRSLAVPGWGQYSSGIDNESKFRKIKGGILFTSFIGAGAFAAVSYRNYIAQKNKTKEIDDINKLIYYGYNPQIPFYPTYIRQQLIENNLNLDSKLHTATSASAALAFIYLINLIDAYFFTYPLQTITSFYQFDKPYQINAYIQPEKNGINNSGTQYILEYKIRF